MVRKVLVNDDTSPGISTYINPARKLLVILITCLLLVVRFQVS